MEEWNNEFYIPTIEKTFKHLKKGGHYCLNIPKDLYKNVAIKLLGKPSTKIVMPKSKRTNEETYQEFIYIWKKL